MIDVLVFMLLLAVAALVVLPAVGPSPTYAGFYPIDQVDAELVSQFCLDCGQARVLEESAYPRCSCRVPGEAP